MHGQSVMQLLMDASADDGFIKKGCTKGHNDSYL